MLCVGKLKKILTLKSCKMSGMSYIFLNVGQALASVVSWNVRWRPPFRASAVLPVSNRQAEMAAEGKGTVGETEEGVEERGGEEVEEAKEIEATTPEEPPEEPLDPYDFNAGVRLIVCS